VRYWVYDERSKKVLGPHLVITLINVAGFGPETKVAPYGTRSTKEWKPAKDVPELAELFSAPPGLKKKKKGAPDAGPAAPGEAAPPPGPAGQ
jgi:hypothetical protein